RARTRRCVSLTTGRSATPDGSALAGDEDAVARRDDAGLEVRIVRDELVVAADRLGRLIRVILGNAARPKDVVADVEAARANPLPSELECFRVIHLVDVTVDDVEGARSRLQNLL